MSSKILLILFNVFLVVSVMALPLDLPSLMGKENGTKLMDQNDDDLSNLHLTNETTRKIYEKASEIMAETDSDSVLMEMEPFNSRNNKDEESRMILVVRKPNTTAEMDLLDQFNSYYIKAIKADPAEANLMDSMWNTIVGPTRDFVIRRFKSISKLLRSLINRPIQLNSSNSRNSEEFFPNILPLNRSDLQVFLLIPNQPPVDSPDVGIAEDDLKDKNFTESVDINPNIHSFIIGHQKVSRLLPSGSSMRHVVRPIGAFNGLNLQGAGERPYTTVGTLITNTGLHLNFVNKIH